MFGNMRKYISILFAGVFCLASCQHDVIYEIDYNITLDGENTYYAGDPVKFNITGDVENLVFYSGEIGSQYVYKDRYYVDSEEINNATLSLDVRANYGTAYGSLEVWISNSFTGLTGKDGAKDRATIKEMVDGGMKEWTKLPYEDLSKDNGKWSSWEFSLNDYLDNMTIAFHWCPPTHEIVQRTYWINGTINVEMTGVPPITQTLRDMGCVKIMMNENLEPLHNEKNVASNGSMRLPQPDANGVWPEQHLIMQGVGANVLTYALDGWVITKPQPLSKVANDKGIVIKNLQNYLHSYEYVWNEPGTYKVVFVGRNENYASASEQVYEYTINILEKPVTED